MVPQHHDPGKEAEVDLSESLVDFPDAREKVFFFHMRACSSGKSFHWPLHSLTQQAFLEVHTIAFEHFGGVFVVIRYDNLTKEGASRSESHDGLTTTVEYDGKPDSEDNCAPQSAYLFHSAPPLLRLRFGRRQQARRMAPMS
jgi:hypothetical protein